jgi:SAM-dependent methyltransferase
VTTSRARLEQQTPFEPTTNAPPMTDQELYARLHETLHPLSDRQAACLTTIAGEPPQSVLRALQAGVLDGIRQLLIDNGASAEVHSWALLVDTAVAAGYLDWLDGPEHVRKRAALAFVADRDRPLAWTALGDAYEAVMPGDLRHRLGEHYTPRMLVERAGSVVTDSCATVLDPACGDGRFLGYLLTRGHDPARLVGMDVNPLAVVLARTSLWITAGRPADPPPVRLNWGDYLLSGSTGPLPCWPTRTEIDLRPGFIVGNPPWVLWRNLGDAYRAAVGAAFANTKLNQASGWAAKVAAGQTDLAHLFVHEALERLAAGGQFGLVLPRSAFKGPIGASVIRVGRLESGRRYGYTHIVDYRQDAFPEVRTEAVVAYATTDITQVYPVPWETANAGLETILTGVSPSDPDDVTSPWSDTENRQTLALAEGQTRWQVRARGGVNTGGGNGIFHVNARASDTDGVLTVTNRPARGLPARTVTGKAERAMVRPMLSGKNVQAWQAIATASIVFPHDPEDLRKPLPEADLAARAPLTMAFLNEFRQELSHRKELARWGGEFYSLFRVGPYTSGSWRVVWPSSSAGRFRAAVLRANDETVPDQKVVIVAFDEAEPAYYLCGLLNSTLLRETIAGSSGLDASPSLTGRLVLPAWKSADEVQQRVVAFAKAACSGERVVQADLDELVAQLYV